MKKKVFLILFLVLIKGYSQIESGEVTYKLIMNLSSNEDIYKKSAQKGADKLGFLLEFDNDNSLFKQIEKIENEEMSVVMATAFSGYSNPIVYNKKSKVFVYNNVTSPLTDNKEFLIQFKDTIGWKLINETKKINNYTCYKATSQRANYFPNKTTYSEVIVWYCPEIALPYGPLNSGGLPGLIFELHNVNASFVIDKIAFNKKIALKIPKKGKLVSETEFNKIFNDRINEVTKKMKEENK